MVNYQSDETLAEIHDEMYRREESRPTSGFAVLSQQTKFAMGIAVAGIMLLVMNDKITTIQGVTSVVAGIVIFYFMGGQEDVNRKELTCMECLLRLTELLKFFQDHPIGDTPQVPKGKIEPKLVGRKQWYEGRAFKRSFGVDIYDQEKDIREHYFAEVDVFTGDIITFKTAPEGVTGDETKDIKIMATREMMLEKKKAIYLDKAYKKI